MSTYAIGDVQGCFAALQNLLEHIGFNPRADILWFAGDLVNRGPQSLATLRFIQQLGRPHQVILGNHDLHLLALSYGAHPGWKEDSLQEILTAPDRDELLFWLRQQPLIHHDASLNFTMVHAGMAAAWDLTKARGLALEVETVLKSDSAAEFFQHMYGNLPDRWDDNLTGWERMRCITNFFTRIRFCYADGRMDLNFKGTLENHPQDLMPWFQVPHRANQNLDILFGHWAALNGVTHTPKAFALDTGCVWGYNLTALRLEDRKYFQVPCSLTGS